MPVEELMVLDQFLAGVSEDLRVWLKERKPGSFEQAIELADDYALARGIERTISRKPQPIYPPTVTSARDRLDMSSLPFQPKIPVICGHDRTNVKGDRRCFQCSRYGHLMYNCPIRNTQTATETGRALYARCCNEVTWNDLARAQRRGREQEIQLRPDCWSQAMRNGSSQLRDDEQQGGMRTSKCGTVREHRNGNYVLQMSKTVGRSLHFIRKWTKAVKSWLLRRQTTRDSRKRWRDCSLLRVTKCQKW